MRRLRTIADPLGVTVEDFFVGMVPGTLADTEECLQLWHRSRTDTGRASVLVCLRAVLAQEVT